VILDFTKGGVEVRHELPTLLVVHLLDHQQEAEGFLRDFMEEGLSCIEPEVCRNMDWNVDIHEHVIRRKHLRIPLTELEIYSAHQGTELKQRTGGPGETLWTRENWSLHVFVERSKWWVELSPYLSWEIGGRSSVKLPLPDYDPDSVELGELEQQVSQGLTEAPRTSAWELILQDDPCLPE
jgi:hypothetical protein